VYRRVFILVGGQHLTDAKHVCVMITGDDALTGVAISRRVGIIPAAVNEVGPCALKCPAWRVPLGVCVCTCEFACVDVCVWMDVRLCVWMWMDVRLCGVR
jgi:magnesium-transporting ATPase (P-type)